MHDKDGHGSLNKKSFRTTENAWFTKTKHNIVGKRETVNLKTVNLKKNVGSIYKIDL
jgi:hypothetical protein